MIAYNDDFALMLIVISPPALIAAGPRPPAPAAARSGGRLELEPSLWGDSSLLTKGHVNLRDQTSADIAFANNLRNCSWQDPTVALGS